MEIVSGTLSNKIVAGHVIFGRFFRIIALIYILPTPQKWCMTYFILLLRFF